jgi:hypothetical protein
MADGRGYDRLHRRLFLGHMRTRQILWKIGTLGIARVDESFTTLAMAKPFTLKWFLLHSKFAHLGEYFQRRGLLGSFPFESQADGAVDELLPALQALSDATREACEREFREIYRLGNRAGCDAIVVASRSRQLHQPGDEDFVNKLGPSGSSLLDLPSSRRLF